MADKQTTAVDFFFDKIKSNFEHDGDLLESVAMLRSICKDKEREQIQDAWISAWQDSMLEPLDRRFYEDLAEEYYTETYGKE